MARKFPRRELVGKAKIKAKDLEVRIHVTDISCDGLSVMEINEGEINHLSVGDSVVLIASVEGQRVEFNAQIVWRKPMGAGVLIEKIDDHNFKGWLKILNIAFRN